MVLNKLRALPPSNSRHMRAYMAAILEVTGMMSGEGFPLRLFMNHISTHLRPKVGFPYATLREDADGLIFVTDPGYVFFRSRLSSSPVVAGQRVTRGEVVDMIRFIVAPSPAAGWTSIDVA